MKTTWYEKYKRRMTKFGKKNIFARQLALIFLMPVISVHNAILYIKANGRRFSLIACAVICVLVNTSFKTYSYDNNISVDLEDELSNEKVALSDTMNVTTEVVIDDNEVVIPDEVFDDVFYYEDEFYYDDVKIDTFSIDEMEEVSDNNTSDKLVESALDFSNYEFLADDWRYLLINKQHPIPDDYTFTLGTIKGDMQCDERVLKPLFSMLQAAKQDGVTLVICSPYRDMKKQEVLFERKVNKYMAKGYSYLEAYKITSHTVTVPGASEHQIGLAFDFISNDYRTLDYGFENCDAGKWLKEHSCEYGFILRYPYEKIDITGIDYEPWHFRYVGVEAATLIMNEGLTLEEFTTQYLK